MKTINNTYRGQSRAAQERRKSIFGAVLLGALLLSSVSVVLAQAYGVRRTTVVRGPNTTVVKSNTAVVRPNTAVVRGPNTAVVRGPNTTVVATGGALPRGYIAALPGGYRAVVVSGTRYYTVGGIYYRPQIYGGRTVYVRVHI